MRLVALTNGVGIQANQTIEETVAKFKINTQQISFSQINQGGPDSVMLLSHVQHLYEILERSQIQSLLNYLTLERPD